MTMMLGDGDDLQLKGDPAEREHTAHHTPRPVSPENGLGEQAAEQRSQIYIIPISTRRQR